MKILMKVILDKDEFEDLKSKYDDQEMEECRKLFKLYYSEGVFKEMDIDPEIMEKVEEYFTDTESESGEVSERLDIMLADENNPDVFIVRKSVSDVIRHVETYLKMCPYY